MMSGSVPHTIGKCLRQIKWCHSNSKCVGTIHCFRSELGRRRFPVQNSIRLNFNGHQCRCFSSSESIPISYPEYEIICNETLESLTDYFDVLIEENTQLVNTDITYGDGVLTVNFGDPHGTYVINRQTPNKQIWLSSPTSGPKRYDFDTGKNAWIYKHDAKSLHDLLQEEIGKILDTKLDFHKHCSHSGKHR